MPADNAVKADAAVFPWIRTVGGGATVSVWT
jgi:hypothetical protein